VNEEDSAGSAAKLMRDANVGFLPVCSMDGTVVGTITDRDIVVRLAADDGDLETRVSELMTREVVSCRPKDDLSRAEKLMEQRQKARIVCTDDKGRPLGIISLSDIVQHEDAARVGTMLRNITRREVH
jgi:CBS domain-containing protein